jgi:hypothetical protein
MHFRGLLLLVRYIVSQESRYTDWTASHGFAATRLQYFWFDAFDSLMGTYSGVVANKLSLYLQSVGLPMSGSSIRAFMLYRPECVLPDNRLLAVIASRTARLGFGRQQSVIAMKSSCIRAVHSHPRP